MTGTKMTTIGREHVGGEHTNPTEDEKREFTIISSGHGSRFRYDGLDPKNPPPPETWMTQTEAEEKVQDLELNGDTIGLRCLVVHAPTHRLVPSGEIFECKFGDSDGRNCYQIEYGLG